MLITHTTSVYNSILTHIDNILKHIDKFPHTYGRVTISDSILTKSDPARCLTCRMWPKSQMVLVFFTLRFAGWGYSRLWIIEKIISCDMTDFRPLLGKRDSLEVRVQASQTEGPAVSSPCSTSELTPVHPPVGNEYPTPRELGECK